MALEYITKGDTIKIDVIKVLIDHEDERDVYETLSTNTDASVEDFLRYEIINSSFGLASNCARNAVHMKPYFGKHAYTLQTVVELFK